ncbi:ribosome rescue GTPase HflX [Thorsellia kenyensis]|uniref:GTPase HflX n=1 Tax=Thorsellia kenyensis TaxID=1549888 RepID=A0ABV6C9S3_9GAMM
MFDRHEGGEEALLVHIDFHNNEEQEDLLEFEALVISAGVTPLQIVTASRKTPHAKYFIGEGKAEELAQLVKETGASVILFNHSLSAGQERNLEKICECRVVDRIGLILDIFAQRARTHEGKLQVELAQLRHLSTRLVRGWTHLERQKGGIGLRGPGETQLETDRRLLRGRIAQILGRLEKVAKQRDQSRRARVRAEIPQLSLVGYTNAGKSSLFNRLTEAKVYAADQLFATLDPTLRRLDVEKIGTLVIADTVGFIRHLPHDLVAAFKATLQETREATLLLHVIDCSDERREENITSVESVLEQIEADKLPILQVMNKIDLLEDFTPRIEKNDECIPIRVWVSAHEGIGIDLLWEAISEILLKSHTRKVLILPPKYAGQWRSYFYNEKMILSESISEDGELRLEITISHSILGKLIKKYPYLTELMIDE